MARYAEIRFTYGTGYFPDGFYVDLHFGSSTVRFTATHSGPTGAISGGYQFNQYACNIASYIDGLTNMNEFTRAITMALLALGINNDYEAGGTYDASPGSFTQGGRPYVRAKQYGAAYNLALPNFGPVGMPISATQLTNISPVVVTADVLTCTCFGDSTGSISLDVQGGWPPYSYLWSDGVTTRDRTAMAAGDYTVTVTDSDVADPINNPVAPIVQTVPITVPQNARVDVVIDREVGTVDVSVTGGVGPYTYLWADGPTTAGRTNLPEGTYTLTVSDSLGCSTQVTIVIPPFERYWSRNPILLNVDAGDSYRADPTTKPNLSFTCEVWLEQEVDSNVYTRVATVLEQPADRNGRTTFQVQELLDPYLEYFVPSVIQRGIVRATPLYRRFYLQYAEVYGTPPVPAGAAVVTQHIVARGGLSFAESRTRTWFNSYHEGRKAFLTWQPNNKPARRDQPEFLFFQALDDFAALRLRCRVTFSDATTTEFLIDTLAVDVRRYEVFCIGAGYNAIKITTTKRITAWEVWLTTGEDVVVSEVRRYELDERPRSQVRYFLFANSLGGLDTLVATGDSSLEAELTAEDIDLALPPTYNPLLGDTAALDRELRPVWKVSTGLKSRSEQIALQELLLSRRVLMVAPGVAPGGMLAGVVRAKSALILDDANPVRGFEFEFALPRERSYTPTLPITPSGLPVGSNTDLPPSS